MENNSATLELNSQPTPLRPAPPNDAWMAGRLRFWLRLATLFVFGACFSAVFPSVGMGKAAWIGIVPLFLMIRFSTPSVAWLEGFTWGFGWSVFSFFWLREIEPFLPFVMASVLALFTAFWAAAVPILLRHFFASPADQLDGAEAVRKKFARCAFLPQLALALSLAAWWVVLEWVRSWIATGLPWNLVGCSQWNLISIIQIAAYTGVYGVSFLVVFLNLCVALGGETLLRGIKERTFRRPFVLYVGMTCLALTTLVGFRAGGFSLPDNPVELRVLAVQGDIPQSRFATGDSARKALDVYTRITSEALVDSPELVIWPETAVPIRYRGTEWESGGPLYRNAMMKLLEACPASYLIGTIEDVDGRGYNSAILINPQGQIVENYAKMHLVPWGEYTPYGDLYPGLKRHFGMGRDLSPGLRHTVFNIKDGVRAGALICFEDVFPEIARGHVMAGANLLVTLTNDAWYPNSDEPYQHLVQAVFRSVETRRPMIRVGNNSGTCVILPDGRFADAIYMRQNQGGSPTPCPEWKGRGKAIFELELERNPPLSFYTRWGNLFVGVCGVICLISAFWAAWSARERIRLFRSLLDPTADTIATEIPARRD